MFNTLNLEANEFRNNIRLIYEANYETLRQTKILFLCRMVNIYC